MKQNLENSLSALASAAARLESAATRVKTLDGRKTARIERGEVELYEASAGLSDMKERISRARKKISEMVEGMK
ncbi:MAG: hypothetical protein LBL52_02305 [Rickettsiales bacterium]|jgi:hypothetical protein|nr:hypothetical protein [Rickettsiales bacterium]